MTDPFHMQPLESRRHLNGDPFATLSTRGTLIVLGDASANAITVTFNDANGTAVATRDGESLSFSAAAVQRIRVEAGGGDDTVTISGPRPSTLLGEGGDDTLTGSRRDDSLDGGSGDDVLDGPAGSEFLGGGDGFDTADYFSRTVGFSFSFTLREEDGDVPTGPFTEQTPVGYAKYDPAGESDTIGYFVEAIGGTSYDDRFNAIEFGEIGRLLDGRGGNDYFDVRSGSFSDTPEVTLRGGAGDDVFDTYDHVNDTICGDQGNDVVFVTQSGSSDAMPNAFDRGAGRDRFSISQREPADLDLRLYPSTEDVVGVGFTGPMTVIGNELANRISGQGISHNASFPITLHGMGGNDTLEGGDASDALYGGDGDDLLIGGLGNDTLRGEGGSDVLGGNGGNDRLFGHGGNDNMNGGNGADALDGGSGTDTFNGGAGNDRLFARDGVGEIVNGGAGADAAQVDDDEDALFRIETELP
jgi:Ca2+-binding RTX toxin-like protein